MKTNNSDTFPALIPGIHFDHLHALLVGVMAGRGRSGRCRCIITQPAFWKPTYDAFTNSSGSFFFVFFNYLRENDFDHIVSFLVKL